MRLVKCMTALLCAVQVCLATLAGAAPLSITLPPETAAFKPSTMPGYALAQQKCSVCHSADYINFQPPGMSLAQWTAEAGKMQHVYGAPISDREVSVIGAYLAVTYGSAKANDADVQAASNAPAVAVAKVDAKALLQNNACLSCHAIDHKVVGRPTAMWRSNMPRTRRQWTGLCPASSTAAAGSGGMCPCRLSRS